VNLIQRLRAELAWLSFQYTRELLSEEGYPDGFIWLSAMDVSDLPSTPGVILLRNLEGQVTAVWPCESLSDRWTAILQDARMSVRDLCSIVPTPDLPTAERLAVRYTPAAVTPPRHHG
jgi:hypothetical protein